MAGIREYEVYENEQQVVAGKVDAPSYIFPRLSPVEIALIVPHLEQVQDIYKQMEDTRSINPTFLDLMIDGSRIGFFMSKGHGRYQVVFGKFQVEQKPEPAPQKRRWWKFLSE